MTAGMRMESSGEETERLTGRKTQPKSQVRNLSDREKSKHKEDGKETACNAGD